ncbi:CsbD family protein [Nonomuraea sp. ZG12]|jgi:uncharacterized protein YjbJ (UPF0337 family)|uniref:CsbD family protein n=1 Tax=Nonomuraea sp. ZG12 TaxID=3452207 RepID=UPI003F8BEC44
MSTSSKIRAKAQVLLGRVKQRLGLATGDQRLRSAGRNDQVMGNLKQAGEKAKNAFRR